MPDHYMKKDQPSENPVLLQLLQPPFKSFQPLQPAQSPQSPQSLQPLQSLPTTIISSNPTNSFQLTQLLQPLESIQTPQPLEPLKLLESIQSPQLFQTVEPNETKKIEILFQPYPKTLTNEFNIKVKKPKSSTSSVNKQEFKAKNQIKEDKVNNIERYIIEDEVEGWNFRENSKESIFNMEDK